MINTLEGSNSKIRMNSQGMLHSKTNVQPDVKINGV